MPSSAEAPEFEARSHRVFVMVIQRISEAAIKFKKLEKENAERHIKKYGWFLHPLDVPQNLINLHVLLLAP